MAGQYPMRNWRDVARYVSEVVQPALEQVISSLAGAIEHQTADHKRLNELVKAHNELAREVRRMKEQP
jgi:hypothetical protein